MRIKGWFWAKAPDYLSIHNPLAKANGNDLR